MERAFVVTKRGAVWRKGLAAVGAAVLLASCDRPLAPTRIGQTEAARVQTAAPTAGMASLVVEWRCLTASSPDSPVCSAQALSLTAGAAATAPGAPLALTGSAAGDRVTLNWRAPATGDAAAAYVIEAGSAPGRADLANFDSGSAAITLTATGVPTGTYYVRVRARNAGGAGPASNEVVVIVAAACTGVPNAPTDLATVVNGAIVTLTWTGPSGGCPPASYLVRAGYAASATSLSFDTGNALTSYTENHAEPGVYFVRVHGLTAAGPGPASNEAIVRVSAPPLALASFVAFGDSITAGESGNSALTTETLGVTLSRFRPTVLVPLAQRYPSMLQSALGARYLTQTPTVANQGQSGEAVTDPGTLERFTALVSSRQYSAVLLMEGTNDLFGPDSPKAPAAVAGLRQIVRAARDRGVRPYLATIPPMNPRGFRGSNYSWNLVPAFNDAIRALAAAENVTLVDVNQGFNNDLGLLGIDGLHPNADGFARIAETFFTAIKATLETATASTARPSRLFRRTGVTSS